MRLVLDTNTVVAGLLWNGPPRSILGFARSQRVMLFTFSSLLLELNDVLNRPKFASRMDRASVSAAELVLGYTALCRNVVPAKAPPVVLADPADDAVIACAVTAGADVIVSGDRHLLTVEIYQRIRIVNAAGCLALIESV